MPRYNYICEKHRGGFIFEVTHGMKVKPEIMCPKCGKICQRTYIGMTFDFFFPGNGLVKDKAGAKRDMNLWHLTHNDPYGKYREKGEVADLADRLKRAGRHQRNAKTFGIRGLKKG